MKKLGMVLLDETPLTGAGGESIAFIHPKNFSGVLMELIEEK